MTLARLTPANLLSMACSSTLTCLLLVSAPASAQDRGAAASEIIHITGTRLTGLGATAASPPRSITAEEIQAAQPVAVEEFFKNLPAAAPAIGRATNNGNIGGATIDLRGLGSNRTLVLINGRRVVPFNLSGTVDSNVIPLALLSRLDVVTGGASAVYGADAVAGVANFNLKRKAPGLELRSSYGKSGSGDTGRSHSALTWGTELDQGRANLVLGLESTRAYPLFQGDRVAGASSFDSVTGLPSGSGITIPALISVSKGAGGSDALAGNWQIDPATGRLIQPVANYNFNPQNYYMTGLDRLQSTALASYVINEQAELYADLFHTNSTVLTTLAESGTALNIYNVPIGNPFIPDAMRQQLCARRGIPLALCAVGEATVVPVTIGRRFTEMPYRHSDFDNRSLQATLGVKGSLPQGWRYDSYWSHGRSRQTLSRRNFSSLSRLNQALNALDTNTCIDPAGGCVPLNVFGPAGSLTPAMIEYIRQDALLHQSVSQDVIAATVSGDLAGVASPWARQPLNIAFGAERRKMSADTASDAASQLPGEVIGSGAPTPDRSGAFTTQEVSLEALLPLAQQRPALHSLHLTAGYRYTTFSTSQTRQHYTSFKYGGEWAPLASLRFHGMLQQAVRAPNIDELFAPQTSSSPPTWPSIPVS
ncbi:TonB-dependent receptor plug domain-containing protein [Rugamonas sp. CCM 8940]|uniref:TonB-dependent receptor plug domain-containing protein n=1 Tax=Rugamonas sp. CCM 8940 TaxID=2765359 RepID=UPI003621927C